MAAHFGHLMIWPASDVGAAKTVPQLLHLTSNFITGKFQEMRSGAAPIEGQDLGILFDVRIWWVFKHLFLCRF